MTERFADHQIGRGLIECYGVVRPPGVGRDADVTRGHVRQVLEEPQREHLRQADVSPPFVVELSVGRVDCGKTGFDQIVRRAQHQIRAEFDPQPFGGDLPVLDGGVVQSQSRRGKSELDLATHHPNRLFLLASFGEFRGIELANFAGDAARNRRIRQRLDRTDSADSPLKMGPEIGNTDTDRADDPDPGNNNLPL